MMYFCGFTIRGHDLICQEAIEMDKVKDGWAIERLSAGTVFKQQGIYRYNGKQYVRHDVDEPLLDKHSIVFIHQEKIIVQLWYFGMLTGWVAGVARSKELALVN